MLKIGKKKSSTEDRITRLRQLGEGLEEAGLERRTKPARSSADDGAASGGFISSMEELSGAWAAEKLTHQKRAPEFWLKSGESRLVRLRCNQPIGGFFCHRRKVNGKWQRFIVDRDNDLLADAWGTRRSLQFVWEVFDIEGYTNKDGKKITDCPRFWVVSNAVHQNLLTLQAEYEAEGQPGLTKRILKIKKTGEGKSTVYTLVPRDPSPRSQAQKEAERLDPMEFYKALTVKEQRSLVRELGAPEGDED